MEELSNEVQLLWDAVKEAQAKIGQLQLNTMSKEAISKMQNSLNENINKVAEDIEQNTEQVRQHVNNLEAAVSICFCLF